MIQRIQSIYLLLACLCYSFFLLLPVFKINTGTEIIPEKATDNTFLTVLAAILLTGLLINVFLYKNRMMQMRIGWMMFTINLLLLFLLAYQYYLETRNTQALQLSWGAFFPLISLIFNLLAIYHIYKDEKLVRSSERLR
jgi:tellurite resistance protein TehA-like permease